MKTEQTLYYKFGWGRADLISDSGDVWDVKRDKPKQIAKGVVQVQKYVDNEWKGHSNIKLHIGGEIPSDSFVRKINVDTYYITYRYAGDGVIAYDYYKITNWDEVEGYAVTAGLSIISAFVYFFSQGTIQLQPVW